MCTYCWLIWPDPPFIPFLSWVHSDGNSQHHNQPVRIRLLHAGSYYWSKVLWYLHCGQKVPQPGGFSPWAGTGRLSFWLQPLFPHLNWLSPMVPKNFSHYGTELERYRTSVNNSWDSLVYSVSETESVNDVVKFFHEHNCNCDFAIVGSLLILHMYWFFLPCIWSKIILKGDTDVRPPGYRRIRH